MGRMKEELDKLANGIDTMEIATTIIEVLDEDGVAINKANFTKLWDNFILRGLYRELRNLSCSGTINWED